MAWRFSLACGPARLRMALGCRDGRVPSLASRCRRPGIMCSRSTQLARTYGCQRVSTAHNATLHITTEMWSSTFASFALFPSSPTQSHTAREQASVTVHYRWHPRCDERLSVRWTQRHGGVTYYYCITRDGTRVSVPAWMTDAVHCAGLSLASSPQASTEALAELGKLLQVVLSRWHQEEVPSDETTDTGVSVRKRPPALERASDIHAGVTASVDATATAGSSSARRGEERKRGER